MKKRIIIFFSALALLAGCEIFVIGRPDAKVKTEKAEIDRFTPKGSLLLFKTELDSNNIAAAARMLSDSTGRRLSAVDQYEQYNEMLRLKNLIGLKKITSLEEDSLSPYHYAIRIEIDSFRRMDFNLTKIENYWYISNYK